MKKPATPEAYISAFPKDVQTILKTVRSIIRKAAPKTAEEGIMYGLIGYKLNKKPLVYFGAFKSHIGFYATPAGNAAFKKDIAKFKGAKGSIQFPLEKKIPLALIKRMVAFRVKEVTAQTALKKSTKKKVKR